MTENIKRAAEAIALADTFFITAGAGMGVDSGLPDFRGDEGFWNAYPLLREEGVSFIDLADPQWFKDDPERAWGFYGHRFNLYKATQPHKGFDKLLKWSSTKAVNSFIFTSNVDGHFQKAGFSEKQIHECHGSINYLQCSEPCCADLWEAPALDCEIDTQTLRAMGELPKCPKCGAVARPNILMFGDFEWIWHRANEQAVRQNKWLDQNRDANIVTIEMGAGTAIPTVRQKSESLGGKLVRINPRDYHGRNGCISIPMGSLEALERIEELL